MVIKFYFLQHQCDEMSGHIRDTPLENTKFNYRRIHLLCFTELMTAGTKNIRSVPYYFNGLFYTDHTLLNYVYGTTLGVEEKWKNFKL